MRHEIQTRFDNLDDLITATCYTVAGHAVSYAWRRHGACVIVKGNWAVLRDVVTALDQAGYLY
jgi:hypothetical protein